MFIFDPIYTALVGGDVRSYSSFPPAIHYTSSIRLSLVLAARAAFHGHVLLLTVQLEAHEYKHQTIIYQSVQTPVVVHRFRRK